MINLKQLNIDCVIDCNLSTVSIKDKGVNYHYYNIRHFIDVVKGKAEPDFVPEQGVNMIKILEAIYESAKVGHEIRL